MKENEKLLLLQDYKSRKLELDKLAYGVSFPNLTDKPTTIDGYGITDAYTKGWIDNNCIKLTDGYVEDNILLDNVSLEFRNPDAPSDYYWMYGSNLGLAFGANSRNSIGNYDSKKILQFSYEGITMTAETDRGVMLYNKTKLTFGVPSTNANIDESETRFDALKLSTIVLAEAELQIGDSRIPSRFSSTVKMPRLNILNNSDVYEGALWNSTYNINGTVHDGLHLTHEPSKYLVLGYKNETDGIYYSYMIMDKYEVLKKEGEDWSPIRFEQEAVFRRGLKIGTFFDIQIGGYNLKEKISSLENAITTGTGMVQWNNVLSKPTTISGYGVTDAYTKTNVDNLLTGYLPKTGGVLTGALQILSNGLDGQYNGLLVGNDCYIGDCNYTDTIGIMSATNSNVGYVKFGKLGGQLGFNGTNLVYNGVAVSLYGHTHDDRYYTESEINTKLASYSTTNHNHDSIYSKLGHTHDDRYFTESEINTKLASYSTTNHNHDSIYSKLGHTHLWNNVLSKPTTISGYGVTDAYTKTNVDNLLTGYLPKTGGVLTGALQILSNGLDGQYNGLLVGNDCYIGDCNYTDTIGIMSATNSNVGYVKFGKLGGQLGFNGTNLVYNGVAVSLYGHTHDDRYYTESEINTKLTSYSTTNHNHDSIYSKLGHTHLYDETLAYVTTIGGTASPEGGWSVASYKNIYINKGSCMSTQDNKVTFTVPTTGVYQFQGTVVISKAGVVLYFYINGNLVGKMYKSSGDGEVASFNTTIRLEARQKIQMFFWVPVTADVVLDQLVVKRLNY